MELVGAVTLPLFLALILAAGLLRKAPLFDVFLDGARDGITALMRILPVLVGMTVAAEMFRASGALDAFARLIAPVTDPLGLPEEVVGLALMRPVSGSASLALLNTLLPQLGVDTYAGRTAAVVCAAGETTFYTVAVYFGAVGITETKHTIPCAIVADFAAALFAALFVKFLG